MGRLFLVKLEGPVFGCKECHTDLAVSTDIIARRDYGTQGEYYMFRQLFNVFLATSTVPDRVSDVLCVFCCASIGSYYVDAHLGPCFPVPRRTLRGPEENEEGQGSNDEQGSNDDV